MPNINGVDYGFDWRTYDPAVMQDFNWFLRKVNQRACIAQKFIKEKYEARNRNGDIDHGLGFDVEYFHPTITLDDRMRFIIEKIAPLQDSLSNIIGNTLISHFYGGRGVHFLVSGKQGVFVDFDRAETDSAYVATLRANLDQAKKKGQPIWGTTELHTSIQTASRNFCRQKYGDPNRQFHPVDVIEWVASFKTQGLINELQTAQHIEDAYRALRKLPGIGEYYGFHGAASTSVLPQLAYHHDQRFVAPGPGAVYTIEQLWPNAPKKLHAEAVYFLREQGDQIGLTKNVDFHEKAYNIGTTFAHPQDGLKYYGTEVVCCQFGVYLQIRNDPKKCAARRVARVKTETISLDQFLN